MQMLDSGKELTANEHEWTRMETKKFKQKRKEHEENLNRR
jgi:hypothetical protein